MKIDFKTVKALSSPTRLDIINYSLDNEATPTRISDEIGKSKSTVSNHLEKLVDAGLLEKNDIEGRKRVVYRPTSKTEAIAKGRQVKMSLSLVSSIVGLLGGSYLVTRFFSEMSILQDHDQASYESDMTMDAEPEIAQEAAETAVSQPFSPEFFLAAGIIVIGVSSVSVFLTWIFYRLKD